MTTGISLHIGLNNVDPGCYDGWNDVLDGCEHDADDMYALAVAQGFQASLLKSPAATRDAVSGAIRDAAERLRAGDFFLLTYAGHGGQVLDVSGDEKDDTSKDDAGGSSEDRAVDDTDETWCLYDGQLLDDELRALWPGFAAGVRILVLSDSCHSGSVTRAIGEGGHTAADLSRDEKLAIYGTETPRFRYMPRDAAVKAYQNSWEFYDKIQNELPNPPEPIAATVRLFSGCQDDQLSGEGETNGLFTGRLKKVWNGGKFRGDYASFHRKIVEGMPDDQTPVHSIIGAENPAFDAERPFTL